MLSASVAFRLGALTGPFCTTVALERTIHMLPLDIDAKAHWILTALIEKDAGEVQRAMAEIEALLIPHGFVPMRRPWKDAPDVRKPIADAAAGLVVKGSFEALALALGLTAADLYVAGRTADGVGMVLDYAKGKNARAESLRRRFRAALAALESSKVALIAAERVFRKALRGEPLSPAVEKAVKELAKLASKPLPTFDGEKSRHLYREGESWWSGIARAIWTLDKSFSFPPEPGRPATPTREEEAALREVLARPDDDAARLRWAELAEARQEPRAALVREQIKVRLERRRPPYYACYEPALCRSLLERHPEWADSVKRLGATEVAFRRGFVEAVTIDAATFLDKAAALYRAAPILHVKLLGAAPLLTDLLGSGSLSRLLSLDLSSQGLDDGHVEKLAEAGGLTGLRSLDLRSNRISVAGARRLYASAALPSLVHCPLDGNPCGPLFSLEWTPQECPTQEWVRTDLGESLRADLGVRRWAFAWADEWPPDFDVLTVPGTR